LPKARDETDPTVDERVIPINELWVSSIALSYQVEMTVNRRGHNTHNDILPERNRHRQKPPVAVRVRKRLVPTRGSVSATQIEIIRTREQVTSRGVWMSKMRVG
jgi:hypothetical protein